MPNNEKIRFVQFLHPGGEHKPDRGRYISWNRGKHKRKFIKQDGYYLDENNRMMKDKIVFWGEWEPQSVVAGEGKIDNPVHHGPKYIYEPYYDLDEAKKKDGKRSDSIDCKGGLLQNTDPFVFGDRFLYGICKQCRKTGPTKLTCLEKGAIIVFGSCKEQRFVVDTIFVVGDYIDYTCTEDGLKDLENELRQHDLSKNYIEKFFEISPYRFMESLESKEDKKDLKHMTHRLYIGATYKEPYEGMFSFFPCRPYQCTPKGFKRPETGLAKKSLQTARM